MNRPNPLSYGLLAIALATSLLYAAVQNLLLTPAQSLAQQTATRDEQQDKPVAQEQTSTVAADTLPKHSAKTTDAPVQRQQPAQTAPDKTQTQQTSTPQTTNRPKDSFIPTENISEDLAVSFPVDI